MPPNLSMSTGFDLFRNSNFLTAHERVVNSYIGANISGSYRVTKHRRKPSHSRTKRKSLTIIRIQEALLRKLNNLKPLFSSNEEHCISKEVKGNALASKGKSCRPEATITRGTQRQFSENICSEDDLRSRIFGTFVVKFLACLPLLGFSNI